MDVLSPKQRNGVEMFHRVFPGTEGGDLTRTITFRLRTI
jgi:hypothetical protein